MIFIMGNQPSTSGGSADPFGPTLTQYDLDKAEYEKLKVANDLEGMKKLRARTNPPLDASIQKLLDELITAVQTTQAKIQSDNAGQPAPFSFPSVDTPKPTDAPPKPSSVVTPTYDEPLVMNESFSVGGGGFSGFGVTGPVKGSGEPSRFFPYEVKNDEVARYADGVNQVGNLRKIRK